MTKEAQELRQKLERIANLAEEIGRKSAEMERAVDELNGLKYEVQNSYLPIPVHQGRTELGFGGK